ncbi:yippee-domain-containing protein [Pseudovirgaria hyperparasitica]|uniref:Yippee-domain-containing protein n=1 Tax=Pseudovirgaria hyperparasitica TaxID=470096 RepID=A0A6A6WDP5_9PEZI|nr:yippee-domain-containing protein [Pseudovirgaria hyperparasitica]KAF2760100.1 yippee-domain-containing protein [Pseudovirgaria hyperparasitica]
MPYTSPPIVFPLYLFPSIPFRRRRSSASTTLSASPSSSSSTSPPSSPSSLSSSTSYLRCSRCLSDLVQTSAIISKGFNGRHGRAYLVTSGLPNTHTHKPVPRNLVTGHHMVADISCAICGQVLGWKYVEAADESQRYKIGKYILETKRIVKGVCWGEDAAEKEDRSRATGECGDVEFDSADEDECDALFAGTWSSEEAGRRRARKGMRRDVFEDDLF